MLLHGISLLSEMLNAIGRIARGRPSWPTITSARTLAPGSEVCTSKTDLQWSNRFQLIYRDTREFSGVMQGQTPNSAIRPTKAIRTPLRSPVRIGFDFPR